MLKIDINSDVGEGLGNEDALMPFISSCNIACGGHAGDKDTMRRTIRLALKHQVGIGAHPSYPDRLNFGRKVMDISDDALISSLREQLYGFLDILTAEGGTLHHIKPHGALYNQMAKKKRVSHVFLDAMVGFRDIPIYVPFQSKIQEVAILRGHNIKLEAFADRNYLPDLSLVPRGNTNAVISDPEAVLSHILHMINTGKVKTLDGNLVPIQADTFCVHGDTPSAFKILTYLHKQLPTYNMYIKK